MAPRTYYFTELSARSQYRTVSAFIEWAVREYLKSVFTEDDASKLWDVDENERLRRLAAYDERLLTYEEEYYLKNGKELDNG